VLHVRSGPIADISARQGVDKRAHKHMTGQKSSSVSRKRKMDQTANEQAMSDTKSPAAKFALKEDANKLRFFRVGHILLVDDCIENNLEVQGRQVAMEPSESNNGLATELLLAGSQPLSLTVRGLPSHDFFLSVNAAALSYFGLVYYQCLSNTKFYAINDQVLYVDPPIDYYGGLIRLFCLLPSRTATSINSTITITRRRTTQNNTITVYTVQGSTLKSLVIKDKVKVPDNHQLEEHLASWPPMQEALLASRELVLIESRIEDFVISRRLCVNLQMHAPTLLSTEPVASIITHPQFLSQLFDTFDLVKGTPLVVDRVCTPQMRIILQSVLEHASYDVMRQRKAPSIILEFTNAHIQLFEKCKLIPDYVRNVAQFLLSASVDLSYKANKWVFYGMCFSKFCNSHYEIEYFSSGSCEQLIEGAAYNQRYNLAIQRRMLNSEHYLGDNDSSSKKFCYAFGIDSMRHYWTQANGDTCLSFMRHLFMEQVCDLFCQLQPNQSLIEFPAFCGEQRLIVLTKTICKYRGIFRADVTGMSHLNDELADTKHESDSGDYLCFFSVEFCLLQGTYKVWTRPGLGGVTSRTLSPYCVFTYVPPNQANYLAPHRFDTLCYALADVRFECHK